MHDSTLENPEHVFLIILPNTTRVYVIIYTYLLKLILQQISKSCLIWQHFNLKILHNLII